jgi:hypothetical protein
MLVSHVFVEGEFGAGPQTDGGVEIAFAGESPGDGVAEVGDDQTVSDDRGPGRDVFETIIAHEDRLPFSDIAPDDNRHAVCPFLRGERNCRDRN